MTHLIGNTYEELADVYRYIDIQTTNLPTQDHRIKVVVIVEFQGERYEFADEGLPRDEMMLIHRIHEQISNRFGMTRKHENEGYDSVECFLLEKR